MRKFSVRLEGGSAPGGMGKALSSSCCPLTTTVKWLREESIATQLWIQVIGKTGVELVVVTKDCLSTYIYKYFYDITDMNKFTVSLKVCSPLPGCGCNVNPIQGLPDLRRSWKKWMVVNKAVEVAEEQMVNWEEEIKDF